MYITPETMVVVNRHYSRSVWLFCNLDVDVLGTDHGAVQVHDIVDRDVGGYLRQTIHVQGVVECRLVASVVEVVDDGMVNVANAVGDVGAAHIVETVLEVQLLPLPPELVQVRVVKVEDRVAGAQSWVDHLKEHGVSV